MGGPRVGRLRSVPERVMNRGEVVLVDFPYSDRTGSKLRPATEVMVDPAVETQSGLQHVSVVSCTNLITLDQGLVYQTIGRLSAAAVQQVSARLKTALELP